MSDSPFDPRESYAQQAGPDLSAFDEEYSAVEAADGDEVPDGKYQVRVQRVRLDESRKGDPMLKWDLVVLSGPQANRHIFKNSVITPASLPYVKADLLLLDLNVQRFSDLPNHLDSLLDRSLEVTQRTRGEYRNVYFNKRLQVPVDNPAPAVDLPF